MRYLDNVKTILRHSLIIVAEICTIVGLCLMFAAVGALDYGIEIGSIADPAPDYRRLLIGTFITMTGIMISLWRQANGERSISTQKWIRKLTLQAWINEHSDPSYLGKHENQVL